MPNVVYYVTFNTYLVIHRASDFDSSRHLLSWIALVCTTHSHHKYPRPLFFNQINQVFEYWVLRTNYEWNVLKSRHTCTISLVIIYMKVKMNLWTQRMFYLVPCIISKLVQTAIHLHAASPPISSVIDKNCLNNNYVHFAMNVWSCTNGGYRSTKPRFAPTYFLGCVRRCEPETLR